MIIIIIDCNRFYDVGPAFHSSYWSLIHALFQEEIRQIAPSAYRIEGPQLTALRLHLGLFSDQSRPSSNNLELSQPRLLIFLGYTRLGWTEYAHHSLTFCCEKACNKAVPSANYSQFLALLLGCTESLNETGNTCILEASKLQFSSPSSCQYQLLPALLCPGSSLVLVSNNEQPCKLCPA